MTGSAGYVQGCPKPGAMNGSEAQDEVQRGPACKGRPTAEPRGWLPQVDHPKIIGVARPGNQTDQRLAFGQASFVSAWGAVVLLWQRPATFWGAMTAGGGFRIGAEP